MWLSLDYRNPIMFHVYAFPLMKKQFPKLNAEDIVATQPMIQPLPTKEG